MDWALIGLVVIGCVLCVVVPLAGLVVVGQVLDSMERRTQPLAGPGGHSQRWSSMG